MRRVQHSSEIDRDPSHHKNFKMDSHPVLSILYNKYDDLLKVMSNKVHIILLPEPKTLLNININMDFLKRHIFYKSHIANTYINLLEQCMEMDHLNICTTYGFQERRKCKIIKEESNSHSKFLKVIYIDFPLEGNNGNQKIRNLKKEFKRDQANIENMQRIVPYTEEDKKLNFANAETPDEFFKFEILGFLYYYITVPGYENCIGKKIVQIVTQTLERIKSKNETLLKNTKDILIKRAYSMLHICIWDHLTKNYKNIEKKLQKNMKYLKRNIFSFLKKSNLSNLDPVQIQNIALWFRQIETCDNPIDKMQILDKISKMMCELITYSNNAENCKNEEAKHVNAFDIDSDTLINVLSAIIARSRIKNLISHVTHLHMYIYNLTVDEKIDSLSFMFTIFHSSIIYLYDLETI